MKNFSYTKTPELTSRIAIIESLRKDILLKPLAPLAELELQWTTLLERIYYSFSFKGVTLTHAHIASLFSPHNRKRFPPQDKEILKYKAALDYLYYEWLVSDELITRDSIQTLYRIGFEGKLQISESEIDKILDYVQINPEQPIIQASITQYLFLDALAANSDNERFANLIFILFLYKNGYDIRRLLNPEEHFFKSLVRYQNLHTDLSKSANITPWIEYVTEGIVLQLNKVLNNVNNIKNNVRNDEYVFELNDRQKAVLSLLQRPGTKISNKTVQDMYNVSQITASRDLSKMASMGLIISIGKGRSTYYTKI